MYPPHPPFGHLLPGGEKLGKLLKNRANSGRKPCKETGSENSRVLAEHHRAERVMAVLRGVPPHPPSGPSPAGRRGQCRPPGSESAVAGSQSGRPRPTGERAGVRGSGRWRRARSLENSAPSGRNPRPGILAIDSSRVGETHRSRALTRGGLHPPCRGLRTRGDSRPSSRRRRSGCDRSCSCSPGRPGRVRRRRSRKSRRGVPGGCGRASA